MSQVRDIELDVAYEVDGYFDYIMQNYIYSDIDERDRKIDWLYKHNIDWLYNQSIDIDHECAIKINDKYVVLARYDENQYSSPPNMRFFGIFSSMDKAKDTMTVWAINRGLGNEMLATCTYDWVLIDGVNA